MSTLFDTSAYTNTPIDTVSGPAASTEAVALETEVDVVDDGADELVAEEDLPPEAEVIEDEPDEGDESEELLDPEDLPEDAVLDGGEEQEEAEERKPPLTRLEEARSKIVHTLNRDPDVGSLVNSLTRDEAHAFVETLSVIRDDFVTDHPDYAEAEAAYCRHRIDELVQRCGLSPSHARSVYINEISMAGLACLRAGQNPIEKLYEIAKPLLEHSRPADKATKVNKMLDSRKQAQQSAERMTETRRMAAGLPSGKGAGAGKSQSRERSINALKTGTAKMSDAEFMKHFNNALRD